MDASALCNASKITLSPSGAYVVAWTPAAESQLSATMTYGGPPYATVAALPCLLRAERMCPVTQLILPLTFRSVSWTLDDELLLMPGEGSIKRWRPGARQVEDAAPAIPVSDRSRITLSGLAPAEALKELRGLAEFSEGFRVGPISYWRGRWFGAFLNRSDHRLDLVDELSAPRRRLRMKLSARFVGERAVWAHDKTGQSYLAGGGAFHKIHGETVSAVFPALVNPEPIYNAGTGDLIGAHDDREIRFLDASDDPGLPPLGPRHAYYASITVNPSAAAYAYVLKQSDGGHQIGIGRAGQAALIQCDSTPYKSVPGHQVGMEEWGTSEWRLSARTATLDGDARGTAVIWIGGPGGTVARGGAEFFEEAWLRRGFNAVTIEGSGALGPELGQRLLEQGIDALVLDGRTAAAHVATHLPPGARVVVEGSSLGAIAASTMAQELDRLRGAEAPAALLLVAPWLVYRAPATIDRRHDFRRTNADFARISERASFGPMRSTTGDGFADRMARWRESFTWNGPILAQFGNLDALSRPTDLWTAALRSPRTTVVVSEGGHQVAGSGPKANEQVEAWLRASGPR